MFFDLRGLILARICTYFGLPGSGKSTYGACLIYKGLSRRFFGLLKPKYDIAYTNMDLNFPPEMNVIHISGDDFGQFAICGPRAIIVFDEASQSFDNRDFKNFGKDKVKYFNEIRHHRIDELNFFVQKYDALDSKIRAICSRVFWVRRSPWRSLVSPHFSVMRIPHEILIAKKADASKLSGGEIVSGYVQPSFILRLLSTKRFWGKPFFKYFDSYSVDYYPPLPQAISNPVYRACFRYTYGKDFDGSKNIHQGEAV